MLSLPFTDLQLASRMENQWAHKLKSKTQQQWNLSYLLLVKGAGCAAPCVWALRVVHQCISKGGILRGLCCCSLTSQNHFYKMSRRAVTEIGIYQWHDLTQQESSLPGAGGVRRGPGSVASQPRLTPSHHEAPRAPSWGSAAP